MPASIYILGASAELERAEAAHDLARQAGCKVAFDWPANYRREGELCDEDLSRAVRFASSLSCVSAARRADAIWLLLPEAPTVGAWVELGIAIGRAASEVDLVLVATGRGEKRSIFLEHVQHLGAEDADALPFLRSLSEECAGGAKTKAGSGHALNVELPLLPRI